MSDKDINAKDNNPVRELTDREIDAITGGWDKVCPPAGLDAVKWVRNALVSVGATTLYEDRC